jgi:hypothetical protein
MTQTLVYRRYLTEHKILGKPLGRHVHFDSRSLRYLYTADRPVEAISAALWTRRIPVLDQGDLGSCTGNALMGAVGTSPLFEALPATRPNLDEAEAVKVYSLATSLDSYPGQYPPTDTGSDGLDACKAGQQLGLLSGYTHCLDLNSMQLALQTGPVIIGIDWYSSFDDPDPNTGLVAISKSAYVRGGHEVEVLGVDPDKQLFMAVNSWGTSWGMSGTFCFSFDTMSRLFAEEGDCTVPVLVTAPAPTPTPTPVPVPTAADKSLDLVAGPWAAKRRYTADNKALQAAIKQWETDSGLR